MLSWRHYTWLSMSPRFCRKLTAVASLIMGESWANHGLIMATRSIGSIALRLRHEAQDLPHDLKNLLQLVAIEASKGMGAGAAGFPVERLDLMA
jgi:hypothetical protein